MRRNARETRKTHNGIRKYVESTRSAQKKPREVSGMHRNAHKMHRKLRRKRRECPENTQKYTEILKVYGNAQKVRKMKKTILWKCAKSPKLQKEMRIVQCAFAAVESHATEVVLKSFHVPMCPPVACRADLHGEALMIKCLSANS